MQKYSQRSTSCKKENECIIPTPIELFSLTLLGTRHLLSHICSTIGCVFLLSDITVLTFDLGFIFCQDMRPKEVPRFNVLFSHRHKNQLELNYSL